MFYFEKLLISYVKYLGFDAFDESTASLSVEDEMVEMRSFLLWYSFDDFLSNCSADDCSAWRDLSKDVVEVDVRNDFSGREVIAEFEKLLYVFVTSGWSWISVLVLAEHLQNLHDEESWSRLLLALDVGFGIDVEAVDWFKRRIFQRALSCSCDRLSLHLLVGLWDQLEWNDIPESKILEVNIQSIELNELTYSTYSWSCKSMKL